MRACDGERGALRVSLFESIKTHGSLENKSFQDRLMGKKQVIAELSARARQWGAGIGQRLWKL